MRIKKELSGESSKKIVTSNKSDVKVVIPMVDLVTELLAVRDKIAEMKDAIKPFEELRDKLQAECIQVLKDRKEFSARFQNATATLAVRKTPIVVDEQAAVEELLKRELTDYTEVKTTLNPLFHETYAKEIAKGNATLPGVEVRETEYLLIRKTGTEERRKVTTNDYKEINE